MKLFAIGLLACFAIACSDESDRVKDLHQQCTQQGKAWWKYGDGRCSCDDAEGNSVEYQC